MDKQEILDLISDNKIKKALKILVEHLHDNDLKIEVVLLKRRLESLDQKVRLGVIDEKERNLEENKIGYSAVDLINKIDFIDISLESDELSVNDKPEILPTDVPELLRKRKAEKRSSNPLISVLIGVTLVCTILSLGYYFFFYDEPVDCFDRLQVRNVANTVSTPTAQFDKLHYKDISDILVTFEKEFFPEKPDSFVIGMQVTVVFEKNDALDNRDTLVKYVQDNLKYSSGNLHLDFKKGGEAYIHAKYERYYENRNSIHAVYESDPLEPLLLVQLRRNDFEDISFFNSMFSLSPRMMSTFIDVIDNEENLENLGESVKCLIDYEG